MPSAGAHSRRKHFGAVARGRRRGRRFRAAVGRACLAVGLAICADAPAAAQGIEAITLDEAVRRAIAANPSMQQAAAGILRAEALLQQTRALSLPSVAATLTTRVIGPVPEFAGQTIVPRSQLDTTVGLAVPLLTPTRWAERNQAQDQVAVSQRAAEETRRATAVATAEAYLSIIGLRQVVELNERARDNARDHFQYAQQRYDAGLGSRLNALRAQ